MLKNRLSALFPFVVSLFFHLFLVLCLSGYFFFYSPLKQERWLEVAVFAPSMQSATVTRSNPIGHKRNQLSKNKSPRQSPHRSGLAHLGVSISGINAPSPVTQAFTRLDEGDAEADLASGSSFGSGNAFQALTETKSPLFQYLYSKIDSFLTYPSELVNAQFQGAVSTRLYFDEKGEYEPSRSQIKSSDSYLRVHVARVLRRALAESIPDTLLHETKPFYMDCLFRFEITQNGDQGLIQKQKFTVGKNLFFYRSVYVSKLSWKVGPVSGLGVFAASIDPSWFLEKGMGLFSKQKAVIDPLDKYRDDPAWD